MVGQKFAMLRGDRPNHRGDGAVQLVESLGVQAGALLIGCRMGWIKCRQCIPHQLGVAGSVERIHPEVRIRVSSGAGKAPVKDILLWANRLVAKLQEPSSQASCSLVPASRSAPRGPGH